MKIKFYSKATKAEKQENIKINVRFFDSKHFDYYLKTPLTIPSEFWSFTTQQLNQKAIIPNNIKKQFIEDRQAIENTLTALLEKGNVPTKEQCQTVIDKYFYPEKYIEELPIEKTFYDYFDEYMQNHLQTDNIKRHYNTLKKLLQTYELQTKNKIELNTIQTKQIEEIIKFIKEQRRTIKGIETKRGYNTIVAMTKRLKTFFLWCNKKEYTLNRPFDKIEIGTEKYNTKPIFISIEERNMIRDYNLSDKPFLAVQRDIFIFQCLVGCRVGDLISFRKNDVVGDFLIYIPNKTKTKSSGNPQEIKVPLLSNNKTALEIIERYKDSDTIKLLPFISPQKYNQAIKELFKVCGLTRKVTIQNPITLKTEQMPLCDVASSHIARRTLAGNLYNKVKDPKLIGKITGHSENSRAFNRYRDISDELLQETISLID